MMNEKAFRQYCTKQNIPQDEITNTVRELETFEKFLQEHQKKKLLEKATVEDVQAYINFLRENKNGNEKIFIALLRFGRYIQNNDLVVRVLELLDGADVMERLFTSIASLTNETVRDIIFDELTIPIIGTAASEKIFFTQKILDRMDVYLETETCKKVLQNALHYIPKEHFAEDRKKYLQAENLDTFLKEKQQTYIARLEQHKKEKTLYFTQKITGPVIEYVREHPTTEGGVREGNNIIVTKIPYHAIEYLREKDHDRKKYYYCHCPWVREALNTKAVSIPPIFCNCSAGFYKQYWEAVLEQPVEVEVLETVLQDKDVCKFAVHLPVTMHEQH